MNSKKCCNSEEGKSNILKSETSDKMTSGCCNKSAGCNEWSSVNQNYDIKDSCEKNEKSAGNNQWCSTSK